LAAYLFYAIASMAFLCVTLLVLHRNPMVSTVSMAGAMLCIGGLYMLLGVPFLGFFQIIVYAGAVMVIVLYVIMALGREEDGPLVGMPQTFCTYAASLLLFWQILRILRTAEPGPFFSPDDSYGQIGAFGKLLVEKYSVPFELASLLLVGAMVGAIVLSRRRSETSP
jgi:NADH-quinone oxidoreductase subunit J